MRFVGAGAEHGLLLEKAKETVGRCEALVVRLCGKPAAELPGCGGDERDSKENHAQCGQRRNRSRIVTAGRLSAGHQSSEENAIKIALRNADTGEIQRNGLEIARREEMVGPTGQSSDIRSDRLEFAPAVLRGWNFRWG